MTKRKKKASQSAAMNNPGDTFRSDPSPASAVPAVPARLAFEIPKPRDWQMFQRNCMILFRAELGDPNAQEYGRNGQNQNGIDVLGRRFAVGPDHYVGIQCRCVADPLEEAEIEKDARASLAIKAGLKEIIFVTTAPDSTGSTDAAVAVENRLRGEGYDLTVSVYGWGNLQNLIALHEAAYSAFMPSAVSSTRPQTAVLDPTAGSILAEAVAAKVVAKLRSAEIARVDREPVGDDRSVEDPILHARIDMYRDLFRNDGQPQLAETGLMGLLAQDLSAKPWAKFRILTNLGAVALEKGDEEAGAARYEEALALRPEDPNAVANLALVRTIQRRCDEAMNLARRALAATPRVDAAVAYLLQAAALSDWQGDPETLVPEDLAGTEAADIGLAEFLRRRESSGWEEKTLAICARHEGVKQFNRIRALAILSLALSGGLIAKNGKAAVSVAELNWAADEMTALTEHMMTVHFKHQYDLVSYLNNAAVLLRLARREDDCQTLLRKGMAQAGRDPVLLRILALSQAAQGKIQDALHTLRDSSDGENALLRADLIAVDRPEDAVDVLKAIDAAGDIKLERSRLRAIGETASRIKDVPALTYAIDGLRAMNAADSGAGLFEIRKNEIAGNDPTMLQQQLTALAQAVPDEADFFARMMVAEEAMRRDLPAEAITLLRDRVDLSRPNPAAIIYLQALGAARRDKEFREVLAAADTSLRDTPEMLWTAGAHAWNVGDVDGALTATRRLLEVEPNNARARLFLVEILVRLNRSIELIAELEKPIERLTGLRLSDKFRLASLLQHLGFPERAVALAYRLFLENRDNSQAWTTLSILVLEDGIEGRNPESLRWRATEVADDVAVTLQFTDGTQQYVIVEPDQELRSLDAESWEPGHPLIEALKGLKAGDAFIDSDDRNGRIVDLQHKYVSRCHQVVLRHQQRFPTSDAFRSIPVDVEAPGGLDQLLEELRARREWADHETEQYLNGPLPLAVFAHRVGCDTIDAADGVVQSGRAIKVSTGTNEERTASELSVKRNQTRGCVTDLQTFHTMWRLGIADLVVQTCGPIHVPQAVLDRLKVRRESLQHKLKAGHRSGHYENGKIHLQEVAPAVVQDWLGQLEAEIAWLEANAVVEPLLLDERAPAVLRDHIQTSRSDMLFALTLSIQLDLLFLSNDLPTRQMRQSFTGNAGAPVQAVLAVAGQKNLIDIRRYTELTAGLIEWGCDHVSVNHNVLLTALDLDPDAGEAPGRFFRTLIRMLGGKKADANSHVLATAQFLAVLWSNSKYEARRNQASSLILGHMIADRTDFKPMLRALIVLLNRNTRAADYVARWTVGHFIPL